MISSMLELGLVTESIDNELDYDSMTPWQTSLMAEQRTNPMRDLFSFYSTVLHIAIDGTLV